MKIKVLSEHGYEEAALGFSLSYNSTLERAMELLPKYAFKGHGENKFLESIHIWFDIVAPRYWWCEADTYRLSTKQSESTMHTLLKKPLSLADFEMLESPAENYEKNVTMWLGYINYIIASDLPTDKKLRIAKSLLLESYLQRRIWSMSYKTLQNIVTQRKDHKLPQWKYFCEEVKNRVAHPEFLFQKEKI